MAGLSVADGGHGHDFKAPFVKRRRIHLDFTRDNDHRRVLAPVRIQAEVADAAGHHQPDIAIANFIPAAGLDDRVHDGRVAHRDGQQNGFCGIKQPVNVLLQFEHAAIVGANAFEDAVPIEQAVVENRDFGRPLVAIFSVNKYFHLIGWQEPTP